MQLWRLLCNVELLISGVKIRMEMQIDACIGSDLETDVFIDLCVRADKS